MANNADPSREDYVPYVGPSTGQVTMTLAVDNSALRGICGTRNTFRVKGVEFELSLIRTSGVSYQIQLNCLPSRIDPHWSAKVDLALSVLVENTRIIQDRRSYELSSVKTYGVIEAFRCDSNSSTESEVTLHITVKETIGIHPPLDYDFSCRTRLSDATLLVEGKQLHVTRSILAMQSPYFKNLFAEHKPEYTLRDVSYEDMRFFISLLYPHTTHNKTIEETILARASSLLELARRFEAPAITTLVEEAIVDDVKHGHRFDERLEQADKFQLSRACSEALRGLQTRDDYKQARLANLSDELRSQLLDEVIRKMERAPQPAPCCGEQFSSRCVESIFQDD